MALSKALFTSINREYETPPDLFKELDWFYNFGTDLCANHQNHLKEDYYFQDLKVVDGRARYKARQRSALDDIDMYNKRTFMNPPYGQPEGPCKPNCKNQRCQKRGWHTDVYIPGIGDFVAHVTNMVRAYDGRFFSLALLPVRTDTLWWQTFIKNNPRADVDELPGRVKFFINGEMSGTAPFPSATVLFK